MLPNRKSTQQLEMSMGQRLPRLASPVSSWRCVGNLDSVHWVFLGKSYGKIEVYLQWYKGFLHIFHYFPNNSGNIWEWIWKRKHVPKKNIFLTGHPSFLGKSCFCLQGSLPSAAPGIEFWLGYNCITSRSLQPVVVSTSFWGCDTNNQG